MVKKIISFSIILVLSFAIILSATGCSVFNTDDEVTYKDVDGGKALNKYEGNTTHDSFVIPDEVGGKPVVQINDFAIAASDNLVYLTIGKNVRKISDRAFCGSTKIAEFIVAEGNENYVAIDGVLFTKDLETLVAYPNGKRVKDSEGNIQKDENNKELIYDSYTVPDTVKILSTACFYECNNLKTLVLGNNVVEVCDHAAIKCTSLETLTLNEGLQIIGEDAFSYCDNITEIILPSTIQKIGDYAFFSQSAKITSFKTKKPLDQIETGTKWKPSTKGTTSSEITPEYIG